MSEAVRASDAPFPVQVEAGKANFFGARAAKVKTNPFVMVRIKTPLLPL